jgi:hypothetical protein
MTLLRAAPNAAAHVSLAGVDANAGIDFAQVLQPGAGLDRRLQVSLP